MAKNTRLVTNNNHGNKVRFNPGKKKTKKQIQEEARKEYLSRC